VKAWTSEIYEILFHKSAEERMLNSTYIRVT